MVSHFQQPSMHARYNAMIVKIERRPYVTDKVTVTISDLEVTMSTAELALLAQVLQQGLLTGATSVEYDFDC